MILSSCSSHCKESCPPLGIESIALDIILISICLSDSTFVSITISSTHLVVSLILFSRSLFLNKAIISFNKTSSLTMSTLSSVSLENFSRLSMMLLALETELSIAVRALFLSTSLLSYSSLSIKVEFLITPKGFLTSCAIPEAS